VGSQVLHRMGEKNAMEKYGKLPIEQYRKNGSNGDLPVETAERQDGEVRSRLCPKGKSAGLKTGHYSRFRGRGWTTKSNVSSLLEQGTR